MLWLEQWSGLAPGWARLSPMGTRWSHWFYSADRMGRWAMGDGRMGKKAVKTQRYNPATHGLVFWCLGKTVPKACWD